MNKKEICEELDKIKDGLDLVPEICSLIVNEMKLRRCKTVATHKHFYDAYSYHQREEGYTIERYLNKYNKAVAELESQGFTFKKVPKYVTHHMGYKKEIVGKRFFGLLNKYETTEFIEKTTYSEEQAYEISICCEDKT